MMYSSDQMIVLLTCDMIDDRKIDDNLILFPKCVCVHFGIEMFMDTNVHACIEQKNSMFLTHPLLFIHPNIITCR